jgi:hypothetical protein
MREKKREEKKKTSFGVAAWVSAKGRPREATSYDTKGKRRKEL